MPSKTDLPNWEQLRDLGFSITRIELEPIDLTCVRLVAWWGERRILTLTADPTWPGELEGLLEQAEILLSAECGLDVEATQTRIRERRSHGQRKHRREVGQTRRHDQP